VSETANDVALGDDAPRSLQGQRARSDVGGSFELEAIIGRGASGTVYRAVDLSDGSACAVKVIHRELAGDPQIRGRFLREVAAFTRLCGDHIARVRASGTLTLARDGEEKNEERLYLALDLVEGGSLEAWMREHPVLEMPFVLDVMRGILSALSIAHENRVIHRDLKPGNVLLDDGREAVVIDFGLAKILSGGTGTTGLTAHNMIFGTPEYMAPEQARGEQPDPRSDLYSAGVVLFEMLTGSVPFRGRTALATLTEHMTSDVPSPRSLAPSVSTAVERVVLRALAKDPADRFESAEAFRAALDAAATSPLSDTLTSSGEREHAPPREKEARAKEARTEDARAKEARA
jgi:serine/threonine-protein kinase